MLMTPVVALIYVLKPLNPVLEEWWYGKERVVRWSRCLRTLKKRMSEMLQTLKNNRNRLVNLTTNFQITSWPRCKMGSLMRLLRFKNNTIGSSLPKIWVKMSGSRGRGLVSHASTSWTVSQWNRQSLENHSSQKSQVTEELASRFIEGKAKKTSRLNRKLNSLKYYRIKQGGLN